MTDVRNHMSSSDLLTWSPESPSNELDVLADLLLNKPVLMFNRPHSLHIQTVVFCPRRLYSSLVMPVQFLCSHLSHPSRCSASQSHVTSWVHIAQGKSANVVEGPGFRSMSPASISKRWMSRVYWLFDGFSVIFGGQCTCFLIVTYVKY